MEKINHMENHLEKIAEILRAPPTGDDQKQLVEDLLGECDECRKQMETIAVAVIEHEGGEEAFNRITHELDKLERMQEKYTSWAATPPGAQPPASPENNDVAPLDAGEPWTSAKRCESSGSSSGSEQKCSGAGTGPKQGPGGWPPSKGAVGRSCSPWGGGFEGAVATSGNPFGGGVGGVGGGAFGGRDGSGPRSGLETQLALAEARARAAEQMLDKTLASLRVTRCAACAFGVGAAVILEKLSRDNRELGAGEPLLKIIWNIIVPPIRFALWPARFASGLVLSATHFAPKTTGALCALCGVNLGAFVLFMLIGGSRKREIYIDVVEEATWEERSEELQPQVSIHGKAIFKTSYPAPARQARFGVARLPPNLCVLKPADAEIKFGDVSFEFALPTVGEARPDTTVPFEYQFKGAQKPFLFGLHGSPESGWKVILEASFDSSVTATNVSVVVACGHQAKSRVSASSGSAKETPSGYEWRMRSCVGKSVCILTLAPSSQPTEMSLHFDVPQFTLSGVHVRFCKVAPMLGDSPPVKWIRYLSKGHCRWSSSRGGGCSDNGITAQRTPEFLQFSQTANAFVGTGAEMNEERLLQIWTGADCNMDRALNHVLNQL